MGYLIRRLGRALLVVLVVSSLVFLLIHLIPGDPVEALLGEGASGAERQQLRISLGLDRPVPEQWLHFLQGLLRLDLGQSLYSGRAVHSLLAERLPATLQLALCALSLSVLIALPLGALSALRRGGYCDRMAMMLAMIGVAVPNFLMGPLLILVFSLYLGWFPIGGQQGPLSVVLPALTLGSALAALLSRMVRASLLEVLHEEYINSARSRGLPFSRILVQHALRNAALPVITVLGLQLGALLAGAVITETVFSWPGLGLLLVESIQRRDYPVVQGCILLISLLYVLVNLGTDLLYAWLDPRIRLAS